MAWIKEHNMKQRHTNTSFRMSLIMRCFALFQMHVEALWRLRAFAWGQKISENGGLDVKFITRAIKAMYLSVPDVYSHSWVSVFDTERFMIWSLEWGCFMEHLRVASFKAAKWIFCLLNFEVLICRCDIVLPLVVRVVAVTTILKLCNLENVVISV